MKITLLVVGKTTALWLQEGVNDYVKRLVHYVTFELKIITELRSTKKVPINRLKQKEGELILNSVKEADFIWLLDEKGKSFNSVEFAAEIERKMLYATKHIVFIVGGAYGFSDEVYKRANAKVSLSKMTYSHQIIRLIFLEQLYRVFTIINGQPYHNQ